MQFGRVHGIVLAAFGAFLLAFQALLFFTAPQRVVQGATIGSSSPRMKLANNPLPGILGGASLIAGMVIFVSRRKTDEPEAKNAVR